MIDFQAFLKLKLLWYQTHNALRYPKCSWQRMVFRTMGSAGDIAATSVLPLLKGAPECSELAQYQRIVTGFRMPSIFAPNRCRHGEKMS